MLPSFSAICEDEPGDKWRRMVDSLREGYIAWFLSDDNRARPSYGQTLRAMREHMPELVPLYERLVELAGGDDLIARLLGLYCPPPFHAACSQLAWTRGDPALVRNYDYQPTLFDAVLLRTRWMGRRVIAMSDCLWGALDGMNEDGLCVSLAFGGRRVVGDGFGVPLLLRCLLQVCADVPEAIERVRRVPIHMAYNVTMLDRAGRFATAMLSPDRPPVVIPRAFATNHQEQIEWPEYAAATATEARARYLTERLRDPAETLETLIPKFLIPPLYRPGVERSWATLYTAVYKPRIGELTLRWPDRRAWTQSFERFEEGRSP
jgi:predicted choloylglycine hydrolase